MRTYNTKINWPLNILLTVAAIAIVGSFYTLSSRKIEIVPIKYATDINPGGNRAILILQNGKKIQLSDNKNGIVIHASKLTYNDGTLIKKDRIQTFTISTPPGGTYQIQLPDSSKIWLNAASTLTYTLNPRGKEKERNIKLSGEAYFEVIKDKKQPFIVTTDKQTIEGLGTRFNVSAYLDDLSSKTTLLDGSVKVTPFATIDNKTKGFILNAAQQCEINSKTIRVSKVDPAETIAWKNGEFSFSEASLENIMQKISRWYNVDIVYTDPKIGSEIFTGTFSRFEKVSQILCLLEATGEVKFKIEERKITVMP